MTTWGVDIDGVLRNWTGSFNKIYAEQFPHHRDLIKNIDKWDWFRDYDFDDSSANEFLKKNLHRMITEAEIYPGAKEHFEKYYQVIKDLNCNLYIITKQSSETEREATKEWLKKYNITGDKLVIVNDFVHKWKYCDILIDDEIRVLENKPEGKVSIKVNFPYNKKIKTDFSIDKFTDLTVDIILDATEKIGELKL